MTRAAPSSGTSAFRSGRTDHGEESTDRKGAAEAEVRGPRLHPVQPVRAAAFGVPQVRAVPAVLAGDGSPRRTAWRDQEQLVTMSAATGTPQVRWTETAAGRAK